MKDIFEICKKLRPVSVTLSSFMAGIFFCEKMYWITAVMSLIIIVNLFYLKSKDQTMKKYGLLPNGKKNLKPKLIKPKNKRR